MHGYLDLFKIFVWSTLTTMSFGNAYHFYISVAEHEARQIRNNITAVASGNAFSHIASFMLASAYNYSHFQVRCLHSCFPTPNIKKASFILALWAPKSLGTANPTHIRAKAFAKSQLFSQQNSLAIRTEKPVYLA